MKDVVIVGAGPAGLFAAYELISNNSKLKITLLDQGFLACNRHCPMNEKKIPCANCNPCNIMAGFGGAGTFSDGKLNFIPKLGKSNLYKYMSISEAEELIDYTESVFTKFGMDSDIYPSNMDEALKIKEMVARNGANLLVIKQKHLGSDNLPKYISDFTEFLKDKGVEILECCEILDYTKEKDYYKLTGKLYKKDYSVDTKNIIIAPGRTGAKWIQEIADKHDIPYVSQSIEVGVRVEVRREILESITNTIYDPSIFIKTRTYDDEIRTFCTNPGGYVTKENYYGYICVNGHALKSKKSNNSNFAFISKISLTEPVTNTREYGESIAKIANTLGGGKPIVQTLKDLKRGRRSTESRINKGFIEPTLKDCVAGDLALVLPHRIITNILEGLETLDKIIPGVANDETLLYGPEIKFFSNEIETDNNMKLADENIYFVGDGAGKAGNIVTAAATGIVAAKDILKTK